MIGLPEDGIETDEFDIGHGARPMTAHFRDDAHVKGQRAWRSPLADGPAQQPERAAFERGRGGR